MKQLVIAVTAMWCLVMTVTAVDMICSSDQFKCDSGQCIYKYEYCDTVKHCPDNSDESRCADRICSENEFQCDSGHCINWTRQCDTFKNCPDNSDESRCVCSDTSCDKGGLLTQLDISTANSYQEPTPYPDEETTRMNQCNQSLGLTDGNTTALRLNSSSEHGIFSLSRIGLNDIGWCALSGDPNPFVQVDLLIATEVEGLRVYNMFPFTYGEETLSTREYQAGAKELVVSYGNDVEKLLKYKDENDSLVEIFTLDEFNYETTISFLRPLISRYVKIDLVGVWDKPCLRLEIIGCRKSVASRLEKSIVSRIDRPRIFASDVYPFAYSPYDTMIWTISTDSNVYPDIYFVDISLAVGDTICMNQTISDIQKYGYVNLGMIKSDMNGHLVRKLSPFHYVDIILTTTSYNNNNARNGRGFIAIVTSSQYRRYFDQIDHFDDTPGLIISEYLLYGPGPSTPQIEVITFVNVAPCNCILELKVIYLNVVCGLSQLIFERSNNLWISTESWCNLNRPLRRESRRIMPRANLKISFHPFQCNDEPRQHGFELKYVYNKTTDRCIELNGDYTMTKKFCLSMEYNAVKATWSEANETCRRKHNGRLATLHTEEEFRMAHQLIHYSIGYFPVYNGLSRVAYIGFRRNPNGQIKGDSRDFTWLDGRPLLYSAWGRGFPNTLPRWDCAVLNGGNFDENAYIENTVCTSRVTEMFICEINSTGRERLNQQVHPIYERGMDLSHLWKCTSGEYIGLTYHCDGLPNCYDESDETECIYTAHGNRTCSDDAFQCSNGKCISACQFCDYIGDCKDNSDEYCDYRLCDSNEFRCNNGQCILNENLCDAKRNCYDGSDEALCSNCSGEGKTTFRCADLKCIPFERVCDGFYDCADMDDEKQCTLEAKSCLEWWKNGKRATGIYPVTFEHSSSQVNVKCSFNENVLLTTLYDVDYKRETYVLARKYMTTLGYRQYDYKLIYPTEEPDVFRYSVNNGRICRQSIRLDCTEPKQKIANIIGKSIYPECICREWIGETWMSSSDTMRLSQIEKPCSKSIVEPSDESNKRFIYGGIVQGIKDITKYPFAKIYFLINATYNQQRITVEPLVCNEEFYPDEGMIPCDKGHPVLNTTRCLYDEDNFGSPIGCADMSHTRHCETFICPPNFVKCPGSYCLAIRLICDGLQQCPNGADETDCGSRGKDCPGYFRCNQSNICLPPSQVCDGFNHCPAGDDEKYCNTSCPSMCICQGTFVDCRNGRINNTELSLLSPQSRKIFFSNSTIGNINAPFILPVAFLVNLSYCAIEEIQSGMFENLKNLRTLDISHNKLTVLHKSTFKGLIRLRELLLHNNQYLYKIERGAFQGLESIYELAIAYSLISFIESLTFEGLKNLTRIDLRFNKIHHVENRAFYGLDKLKYLLISNNEIKFFESEIFSGLISLYYLETDTYDLCCLRPSSVVEQNCFPQKDEFSSCEDLMRNASLRVLLWIIGLLSLVGNLGSLIYRKWKLVMPFNMGYGIFVTNLSVADILMGIYLLIIAVADTHFRNTFSWKSNWWRNSAYCTFAGVLSTISSEASIFFVMLITLDRILVVKFPFGQVRLTPSVCILVSSLAWLIAIALSILPLALSMYFKGKYYSRTTVCLTLPLTNDKPAGWEYSFAIFVALNLFLFVMIAFGQLLIFKETRASSAIFGKLKRSRNQVLDVARNLLMVVFANFLCWFPIGVIGILALMDYTIPGDVYAWASVLVLPINSVLNPILYTLSAAVKREKFVPEAGEQDLISKEDFIRLDEMIGLDVILTTDARNLTCASTCIENHTLGVRQIQALTTKLGERFDFLHKRMMYYGNLTTQNIWIFVADDQTIDVWLQGKPRRAVNKQVQSADIRLLELVRDELMKPYVHVRQDVKGKE